MAQNFADPGQIRSYEDLASLAARFGLEHAAYFAANSY